MDYQMSIINKLKNINNKYLKHEGDPSIVNNLQGGARPRKYVLGYSSVYEPASLSTGSLVRGIPAHILGGKIHKGEYKETKTISHDIANFIKPVAKPIIGALTQKVVDEIKGGARRRKSTGNKLVKGSAAAREWMAHIRSLKKK
jgi:hypothetical protein